MGRFAGSTTTPFSSAAFASKEEKTHSRAAHTYSFGLFIAGSPSLPPFRRNIFIRGFADHAGRSPDLRVNGGHSPSHPDGRDSGMLSGSSALTVAGPCWNL